MKQKIIAIYFSSSGPMDYPFSKKEYYEAYQEIIQSLEKNGVEVYIVRAKSYLGDGWFKKGWRFFNGQLKETKKHVHADLIFNRDDKNVIPVIHDCKIINHPELDELCLDKIKTAKVFPDISPKTRGIHSFREYLEHTEKHGVKPHEIIVLKKNFGSEGRGIYILPHQKVTQDLYDNWNDIVVQEFVDSSMGIPGVVDGLHDLRVVVINGESYNAFIRVPKKGTFLANYSLGGKAWSIDIKKVPAKVMNLIKIINKKLEQYESSLYAADFMNSPKGYKLIEINSRPGVQHPKWSHNHQGFNERVIKMLIGALD